MKPLLNAERAQQILAANLTPRYLELDTFEAYVEGRQYDGMPPWLTENDVPVLERAPCIVEPIAENAIESYTDLVFGDGRFPDITSHVEEDDAPFDPRFGLSEEQSVTLDNFIRAVCKQAQVDEVSRVALARAMGSRTAVGIVCVRDGRLAVDLERAKCCSPTFDKKRPKLIRALDIRYPYLETYFDGKEKAWAQRCMLYRRLIDEKRDVTFAPILAHETGEDPGDGAWVEQDAIEHGFGFCPVIWYPYRKTEACRRDNDGIALHERLLDEIDALNRTLSQKHRAGLLCGDPQTIETGVDPDHNPAPAGRQAQPMASYVGASPAERAKDGKWRSAGTGAKPGRRKGPSVVWRYPDPATKVEYLILPAEALKTLDDEAIGLRNIIASAVSWVRSDPTSIAGEGKKGVSMTGISGKALAWMYKRQTTQCDTVRPDVWNGWLQPLIDLLLRVALVYARDPSKGALYLAGLDDIAKILARFEQPVSSGTDTAGASTTTNQWFSPALSPLWGDYFEPTEADQAVVSLQVIGDKDAGLITQRTAVQRIAGFYDIENLDEYLESLEEEKAQKQADALEQMQGEAAALHAMSGTDADPADDKPAGGVQKKNPSVRSGVPGPAVAKAKPGSGAGNQPRA